MNELSSPQEQVQEMRDVRAKYEALKLKHNAALEIIKNLYKATGVIDNGICAICRVGYRSWKLPKCKEPAGPCDNADCLSRKIDALR